MTSAPEFGVQLLDLTLHVSPVVSLLLPAGQQRGHDARLQVAHIQRHDQNGIRVQPALRQESQLIQALGETLQDETSGPASKERGTL